MIRQPICSKWIRLLSGFVIYMHAYGQPSHLQSGNSYITTGAYSIHFTDAFSFTSNPACLGTIQCLQFGLLSERKWMLEELDDHEMAASVNMGKGGLGIALKYSGDLAYSEEGLQLGYGKNLGKLEMGIDFGYLHARAAGYESFGFAALGIGIRYHVSEKLITGWAVELPGFGKAGKMHTEKGPQTFRSGFGYELRPDLFMALEVEKLSGLPMNVIYSVDYKYGEQLFFTFGINSLAGAPYFKSGWQKNRLRIQIYLLYEPVLGFSPGLTLLWESKNRKR